MGTTLYMAPELSDTDISNYDFMVDIWSLGVTVYELFAKYKPFDKKEDIKESKISMKRLPDWVPVKVRELIEKLLQKDPHLRINTKEIKDWINNEMKFLVTANTYDLVLWGLDLLGQDEIKKL